MHHRLVLAKTLLCLLSLGAAALPAASQVFRDEQEFLDALGGGSDCPFFLVESFETLPATNAFDLSVIDAPNLRVSEPFVDGAFNLGVWNQPEGGRHATDGSQYAALTVCLAPGCTPSIKRLEATAVPIGAIGLTIIDWGQAGAFDLILREDLTQQEIVAAFGGQPTGNEQFVGWIIPGLFTGYFDLVDSFGMTYAIDEVYTCGDILPVGLQRFDVE